MWPRQWLRKGYVDNESSKERDWSRAEERGNTIQREYIYSQVYLSALILHYPVNVPQNGKCQSATSQFEQQKMSRQQKQFELCFFCNEKIWHTVCKDDNKKAFVALWQIQGEPKQIFDLKHIPSRELGDELGVEPCQHFES